MIALRRDFFKCSKMRFLILYVFIFIFLYKVLTPPPPPPPPLGRFAPSPRRPTIPPIMKTNRHLWPGVHQELSTPSKTKVGLIILYDGGMIGVLGEGAN